MVVYNLMKWYYYDVIRNSLQLLFSLSNNTKLTQKSIRKSKLYEVWTKRLDISFLILISSPELSICFNCESGRDSSRYVYIVTYNVNTRPHCVIVADIMLLYILISHIDDDYFVGKKS